MIRRGDPLTLVNRMMENEIKRRKSSISLDVKYIQRKENSKTRRRKDVQRLHFQNAPKMKKKTLEESLHIWRDVFCKGIDIFEEEIIKEKESGQPDDQEAQRMTVALFTELNWNIAKIFKRLMRDVRQTEIVADTTMQQTILGVVEKRVKYHRHEQRLLGEKLGKVTYTRREVRRRMKNLEREIIECRSKAAQLRKEKGKKKKKKRKKLVKRNKTPSPRRRTSQKRKVNRSARRSVSAFSRSKRPISSSPYKSPSRPSKKKKSRSKGIRTRKVKKPKVIKKLQNFVSEDSQETEPVSNSFEVEPFHEDEEELVLEAFVIDDEEENEREVVVEEEIDTIVDVVDENVSEVVPQEESENLVDVVVEEESKAVVEEEIETVVDVVDEEESTVVEEEIDTVNVVEEERKVVVEEEVDNGEDVIDVVEEAETNAPMTMIPTVSQDVEMDEELTQKKILLEGEKKQLAKEAAERKRLEEEEIQRQKEEKERKKKEAAAAEKNAVICIATRSFSSFFKKGDEVEIIKVTSDSWAEGRCNGKKGIFPLRYTNYRNVVS